MDKIERLKELTEQLNHYRDAYYNNSESLISDKQYDDLFDELQSLEDETGIVMSNSPTKTVGYEVKSELEVVKHSHPMLSLGKTKATDDLIKFSDGRDCILSLKMDGLTVLNTYNNGVLCVYCKIKIPKVAKENWRMLHLHIGECCNPSPEALRNGERLSGSPQV